MSSFPYISSILPPAESMFSSLCAQSLPIGGTKLTRKWPDDYLSSDSLSCHYTEEQRMDCNKYGRLSPIFYFIQNAERFTIASSEGESHTSRTLKMNDLLYVYVCNHFNPTYTMWILQTVYQQAPLKVLDFCAGWGDRLIGSLASGVVSEYMGYDSNPDLQSAYTKIIQTHSHPAAGVQANVINACFEDVVCPEHYYDVVLTSPPYGPDLEQYNGAPVIPPGSLMQRYHTWFSTVYTKCITKAFKALKRGGSLVLYVEDYRITGRHFPFRQDTIRLLDTLTDSNMTLFRKDNFNLEVVYESSIMRSALNYIKI